MYTGPYLCELPTDVVKEEDTEPSANYRELGTECCC